MLALCSFRPGRNQPAIVPPSAPITAEEHYIFLLERVCKLFAFYFMGHIFVLLRCFCHPIVDAQRVLNCKQMAKKKKEMKTAPTQNVKVRHPQTDLAHTRHALFGLLISLLTSRLSSDNARHGLQRWSLMNIPREKKTDAKPK